MPHPVSLTASMTYRSGSAEAGFNGAASPSSIFLVSMVNWPLFGIASLAFTARLMITCSICPGSAFTRPKDGSAQMTSSMPSPISYRRNFELVLTIALKSSTFGPNTCCQLKACNCLVNSAAR